MENGMDNIYYEKTLYRIIQGRLRLPFCDPILYLYEPDPLLIEESFDVYDEAYKDAYFKGVFIKEELKEVLFYNDIWTPRDDKNAEDTEKQIENLKVEAYKNIIDPKKLTGIKMNIRFLEKEYIKHKSKINTLDHISCEGVASFARSLWVISKSIKNRQNLTVENYDKPLTKILEYSNSNSIESSVIRYIARNEPFRSMWRIGKNQNIFNRPSCELTKDQISLCQFSMMYDNVYESHESPTEDVINDDDCLDGWFIVKKREHEREKNKREIEAMIGNSKIANSDEIFIMANNGEKASKIYDMNDVRSRAVIHNRNKQIEEAKSINFTKFSDVQQDIAIQARQNAIKKIKGR